MDIIQALEGIPYAAAVVVALLWNRMARAEKDIEGIKVQQKVDGDLVQRVDATLAGLSENIGHIMRALNVDKRAGDP